jgi:NADP-dependent 3-hydroxy acid dehydrogenase YdfG
MAKKGGAGGERTAAGVVPFRGREGNAEPAMEETPAPKPAGKARVVPIARARAIAAAGPRVKARAGRVEVAAAEPAEATQARPRRQGPEYRPTARLAGKVALITGGDSAIGRAVARLFAREGADAAVVYSPGELSGAEELRGEIEAAGQHALLLPGDAREPEFCRQAVERAVAEFGQLDVLVHCGFHLEGSRRLDKIRYEDWDRAFKTGVTSYFLAAQAAAPHLAARAAIIHVGAAAKADTEGMALECAAAQGAIEAFTRALALALAEDGIRVNAVFGSEPADDAAAACLFFASATDSGRISGATLELSPRAAGERTA